MESTFGAALSLEPFSKCSPHCEAGLSRSPILSTLLAASLAAILPVGSAAAWVADGSPVGWDCTGIAENAAAVADDAGGAFFVWDFEGSVRTRCIDATGALRPGWTPCGLKLSSDPTSIQHEHVQCSDGSGGIYVCFRAIVGCTAHCGGDPHAIYLQHFTADGAVAPGWPSTAVALAATEAGFNHFDPALAPDGNGGVVVAWTETWFTSGGDIRAQRVAHDGTILWTAGGVGVCMAAGAQRRPAIVATPGGGALVFWEDSRPGATVSDLYARAIAADGTPDASADGVALCTAPAAQSFPVALADGAGGAFTIWRDARSGVDTKFFAQRVTGSLAPVWSDVGIAVSGSTPDFTPTAIPDAAGGFYLAWTDTRSAATSSWDLYAQRIGPSGAPASGWPGQGIPLAIAPGDQANAQIAPDEAGGFFCTWTDDRTGGGDLFGGHWNADGAAVAGWTANGTALCTATGYQRPVSLVMSAPNGAIAVWVDSRQAPRELAFATRMVDAGSVPAEVSLVLARATPAKVDVAWELSNCPATTTIERTVDGSWMQEAIVTPDGTCRVAWSDLDVVAGRRYGYRLAWQENGEVHRSDETWLEVPRVEPLAIRAVRHRAAGSVLEVECSVPSGREMSLALIDVTGRRCATRRVALAGAGITTATLELPQAIASGVYVLVAEQAGARATRTVTVVR